MELNELTKNNAGHFRVEGYGGVAFYFYGLETKPDEDTEWTGEEVPTGKVLMIMVGDDIAHIIDPKDVEPLDEDEFCSECGQIGCTADGR
jgi:hypothetical protein